MHESMPALHATICFHIGFTIKTIQDMKIDKIYSKIARGDKYWIIARVKQGGEFTIEQIQVAPERFKTVREGDVL